MGMYTGRKGNAGSTSLDIYQLGQYKKLNPNFVSVVFVIFVYLVDYRFYFFEVVSSLKI